MNLALTEEQQFVRQTFSALFGKEADPARVRAAEPLGHDSHLWAHVIATGALGVGIPESVGGGGGETTVTIMLVDPLTAANVLVAVIVAVPVAVGVNNPVDEMVPPVAAHRLRRQRAGRQRDRLCS